MFVPYFTAGKNFQRHYLSMERIRTLSQPHCRLRVRSVYPFILARAEKLRYGLTVTNLRSWWNYELLLICVSRRSFEFERWQIFALGSKEPRGTPRSTSFNIKIFHLERYRLKIGEKMIDIYSKFGTYDSFHITVLVMVRFVSISPR